MKPLRYRGRKPSAVGTIIVVIPGGLEYGGGIGRQMGYFLRALDMKATGVNYRIIDSRGPWFLGSSPIKIAFSGCYLAVAIIKLFMARIKRYPHVVHVNIAGRGSTIRKIILIISIIVFKLQYIIHVHDYDYAAEYRRRGKFVKSMIMIIFRNASKVLVLGARDQENLSKLLELPRHRIAILHNAVPDPLPDDRVRARRSAGSCHVLFLGHLSARKGVPELLQAFATPIVAPQQWHATLAGSGPIEEYRELANNLGIADRIDFPGWLDEGRVKALCADADILVLPSHAEGLAMSVLEGLSYGLAVITTPVGAHPEVIDLELPSGILVPPGDVSALAKALACVIEDRGLRERLRVGARRRFLERFEVRSYAERLGQLHADLLLDAKGAGTIATKKKF